MCQLNLATDVRFSHIGLVYSGCASQAFLLVICVCRRHPDSKSPLDRTVVMAAALGTGICSFCIQKYSIVHDRSVLTPLYLQEQCQQFCMTVVLLKAF